MLTCFGVDIALGFNNISYLFFVEIKMKKIITAVAGLVIAGTVQATPLSLDFNSGVTTGNMSYLEDGFTFAVDSTGNHFDNNWIGAMGFHNGPGNSVNDNNLTLSFGGAAFDLLDIDISNIYGDGTLELTGSNGSSFVSSALGLQSVNFYNVTSVSFSAIDSEPTRWGGASWNGITVDNVPTNSIPEPTSVALFGLALAGFGLARKNKNS